MPWLFFIGDFQEKEMNVSVDELEKMKNWMFMLPEETKHPEKKAFFEYIFELVHISLKKIFVEVKKEIMG